MSKHLELYRYMLPLHEVHVDKDPEHSLQLVSHA